MVIRLNDEYELESNGRCYWINRYRTTKTGPNAGKRYKKSDDGCCGYHRTLSALMEEFLHNRIRELDTTSLQELAVRIEQIGAEVKEMCHTIEKEMLLS